MKRKKDKHRIARALASTLIGFVLVSGSCARPALAAPPGDAAALVSRLESAMPALMKRFGVPGAAVALIVNGEPVWEAAFGWADRERGVPLAADTYFRAESISKSLTAWGALRLALDGRLDLDNPVGPALATAGFSAAADWEPGVSARALLRADAGLPLGAIGPAAEYRPDGPVPSLAEFLQSEPSPFRGPGEGFAYSNLGYNSLELLIEGAAGRSFAAYMAEAILSPLGMAAASFAWNDAIAARLATGYDLTGRPVGPYVYPAAAAGGLFVTVGDVARFAAASARAGSAGPGDPGAAPADPAFPLPPSAVAEIQGAAVPMRGVFGFVADAYGYGHFVETLADGKAAVWHGGQGHGWMTHFHTVPSTGDAIVILTNSQRSWPLIASALTLWADGRGLARPKFARIATLYGLFAALAWAALVLGLFVAALRFACLAPARRGLRAGLGAPSRVLRAVLAAATLAGLAWAATRPYLMLSSIFPGADRVAALALLAAAGNLAAGAASGFRPRVAAFTAVLRRGTASLRRREPRDE
jgi:CubicO group peptidase (beta-lactamase class C family)